MIAGGKYGWVLERRYEIVVPTGGGGKETVGGGKSVDFFNDVKVQAVESDGGLVVLDTFEQNCGICGWLLFRWWWWVNVIEDQLYWITYCDGNELQINGQLDVVTLAETFVLFRAR